MYMVRREHSESVHISKNLIKLCTWWEENTLKVYIYLKNSLNYVHGKKRTL